MANEILLKFRNMRLFPRLLVIPYVLYLCCIYIGISLGLRELDHGVCRISLETLWFHDISSDSCRDECSSRPGCYGVSYNSAMKICSLNTDSVDNPTPVCKGFVYSGRPSWNLPETSCDVVCSKNQTCVTTASGIGCEYKECRKPDIPNSQILGNQRHVGARIKVLCTGSFVILGSEYLTCTEHGTWQPEGLDLSPKCLTVVECPVPQTVESATIEGTSLIEGSWIQGSTLSYVCESGFVLFGQGNFTCSSAGMWTLDTGGTELPACVPVVECPVPQTVDSATIEGTSLIEGSWIQGSTLSYVCESGFVLFGQGNFTCSSAGMWTLDTGGTELPACVPGCVEPPSVDNGNIIGADFSVGGYITYSCHGNYKLVGPAGYMCTEDTVWLPTDTCSKSLDQSVNFLALAQPRCVIENCVSKSSDKYYINTTLQSREEAIAGCRTFGGHLVSFSCNIEYEFVKELINTQVYIKLLIGLNDLDQRCMWKWQGSHDEVTFVDWDPGEPNNVYGIESCVALEGSIGYRFWDYPCNYKFGYICEKV